MQSIPTKKKKGRGDQVDAAEKFPSLEATAQPKVERDIFAEMNVRKDPIKDLNEKFGYVAPQAKAKAESSSDVLTITKINKKK